MVPWNAGLLTDNIAERHYRLRCDYEWLATISLRRRGCRTYVTLPPSSTRTARYPPATQKHCYTRAVQYKARLGRVTTCTSGLRRSCGGTRIHSSCKAPSSACLPVICCVPRRRPCGPARVMLTGSRTPSSNKTRPPTPPQRADLVPAWKEVYY